MTHSELMKKRRDLLAKADAITQNARRANRDLTADETRQHDRLVSGVDELDKKIQPLAEKREKAIDEFMAQSQGGIPYADPTTGRTNNSTMNSNDLKDYSVLNAIRSAAAKSGSHERDISDEIGRRNGVTATGILIPLNALTVTGDPNADSLVPSEHGPLVETLRGRLVAASAGATIMTGLRGDLHLPRQLTTAQIGWKAETASADESTPEFDEVVLRPKRAASFTRFSRQLLRQSDPSVDAVVRNDLVDSLARAIDEAALAGTGANNQPEGILNTTGVGIVDIGDNGGSITHEHLVDLTAEVAQANADSGALGFVSNPQVRAFLQKELFDSGSGRTLWGQARDLAPWLISTLVPSDLTKGTGEDLSAVLFGNWRDLLIAHFGDFVDVIVDEYSEATEGRVRVIINAYVDVAVRRPASFAIINDADA